MHQSLASMGVMPPINESIENGKVDDHDAEERSYASASESERSFSIE
jgi:hypothetical protein